MLTLQWLSSHSATQPLWMTEWLDQPLSNSATLPERLDQPLNHSAALVRVAGPATQPLSHSECRSARVVEWLVQPLWQSGWVAASISRAVLHIHSVFTFVGQVFCLMFEGFFARRVQLTWNNNGMWVQELLKRFLVPWSFWATVVVHNIRNGEVRSFSPHVVTGVYLHAPLHLTILFCLYMAIT